MFLKLHQRPTACSCFILIAFIVAAANPSPAVAQNPSKGLHKQHVRANIFGFTILPKENCPAEFNAGFSMYPTVWSLVERHPGKRYQSGLFGTWMKVQSDKGEDIKIGGEKRGGLGYSAIEGGSGVWRHNRFPTITPKLQMGGVALSFRGIANGPGFGKGRDWNEPKGKYGVAQLSPHVVFPLDGLNYRQGTFGQCIGYGYLPLPLTPAKNKTSGMDVPTGNQSWTLFMNTKTFKGPIAFFTPHFWARHTIDYPQIHGKYFDSSPVNANRHIQMETQHIAAIQSPDKDGNLYTRVTPITYPIDRDGNSHVFRSNTCYDKSALWDSVDAWFKGGPVASGKIELSGSFTTKLKDGNPNTWRFHSKHNGETKKYPIDWKSFAKRIQSDAHTLTYRFDPKKTTIDAEKGIVTLPQYFQLVFQNKEKDKAKWIPVAANKVPDETKLRDLTADDFFTGKNNGAPWTTPVGDKNEQGEIEATWNVPGPKAGPFQVKLGDNSTLTYYWYKFCEQPAIMVAGLTDEERAQLQKKVELIHQNWKPDQEYLPPPKNGELAELDPALLVTPPAGMEVGYVPIATDQRMVK